jgi:glycosyltransferase involved in cell wall biosynthesis
MSVLQRVIFWQNIVSPHQVALFNALVAQYEVVLLVENIMTTNRSDMGWKPPSLHASITFHEIGNIHYKSFLLAEKDSIHFFSGISAYPTIQIVLEKALYLNLDVNLIAEPQNWIGLRGLFNLLRTTIFAIRYGNKVNRILAIGNRGPWWYAKCGFDGNNIFDWGYTIDSKIRQSRNGDSLSHKATFIFVGRLIPVKGLTILIKALAYLDKHTYDSMIIIGDGSELENLVKLVSETGLTDKVEFQGSKSNHDAINAITNADLLILPSIGKEGWGAVVSESLLAGTPVLVSNYVGASVLVNNQNGFVVANNSVSEIVLHLQKFISKEGLSIFPTRRELQIDSRKRFSTEAFSEYFAHIINATKSNKPQAPWLKIKK